MKVDIPVFASMLFKQSLKHIQLCATETEDTKNMNIFQIVVLLVALGSLAQAGKFLSHELWLTKSFILHRQSEWAA